jgi:dTDP-4-amino-4,6-dideoxygalactose transaminase
MITTNSEALYQKLVLLRSHGITKEENLMEENHGGWYYEMRELSHNYRLTDFQAALGSSQLRRAGDGLERRRKLAARYDEAFRQTAVSTPLPAPGDGHAYHLYVVQVPDRLGFYNYLKENGIFAQVHYIPVHYMPYYKRFGWEKGNFPVAEAYYEHCISLPMYPALTYEYKPGNSPPCHYSCQRRE